MYYNYYKLIAMNGLWSEIFGSIFWKQVDVVFFLNMQQKCIESHHVWRLFVAKNPAFEN
jgi:hypothetical protein